jgi:GNAT superfamily N-acetyltransferase
MDKILFVRPQMKVTVRPAAAEDIASVTEVLCASRREYLPYAPMAHTENEVREWIATVLIPGGGVYVAEHESQVVAMLAISHDQDGGWIDQLYVRPGYTGQSVGAQLLRLAHARLTPPIRLFTFQANAGARHFYECQGYRAVRFTDGEGNEERCPDVLYEWRGAEAAA